MSNIMRGDATLEEIESITSSKGKLMVVYAKDSFNINKDGDYDFSDNIVHPDTGEILTAVKGYCTSGTAFERPCYYAEYEGKNGRYYYFDQTKYNRAMPNAMTIREQIDEDREIYLDKFAERDLSEDEFDDYDFDESISHNKSEDNCFDDSEEIDF